MNAANQKIVDDALTRFQLRPATNASPFSSSSSLIGTTIASIRPHSDAQVAELELKSDVGGSSFLTVPRGFAPLVAPNADPHFVATASQSGTLLDMLLSHAKSDICLVGGRGVGKSVLAAHFARFVMRFMSTSSRYEV